MHKLLPKSINHPRGFTLVELLIVITIIAILSLIGITIYSGIQKNARDARRKADIDSIANAYEANYTSDDTPYAIPSANWFATGGIPVDINGDQYYWNGATSVPAAANTGFVVCAKLENANGNSSSTGAADFTFTSANGAAATRYCKKNQQ